MIAHAALICALAAMPATAMAADPVLGSDAYACSGNSGSAIRVKVVGLKDRTGRVKLELYPATEEDFLKDDRDLVRAGKVFHRVWANTPAQGDVFLCIKVPGSGRYALLFTHDRDGRNKFDFLKDGVGFRDNRTLRRSRPKLDEAVVKVGNGVTKITIRAQYLQGLSGFGPQDD